MFEAASRFAVVLLATIGRRERFGSE